MLDTFDEGDTIYCREPWTRDAVALVAREPESGGLPDEASRLGLRYFLEVAIAKEVRDGLEENLGASPFHEKLCDRIVRYAIYDA